MFEKRRFYIEDSVGNATRIKAPKGWTEDNLALPRDEDFGTIFQSISYDQLVFTTDDSSDPIGGAKILKDIYSLGGQESEAKLLVYYRDQNYEYKTFYVGVFNFSEYRWIAKNKTVEINIQDSDDIVRLHSRKSSEIKTGETLSMNGETIDGVNPQELLIQKQDIIRRFQSILAEGRNYKKGQTTETLEAITDNYDPPQELKTVVWGFGVRAFGNAVAIGDYYKGPLSKIERPYEDKIELIDDPNDPSGYVPPVESEMFRPAIYNSESAARVSMRRSIVRLEYKLTGTSGSKEYSFEHTILTTRGEYIHQEPTNRITLNHTGNNTVTPGEPGYDEGWGSLSLGFNNTGTPNFVSMMGNDVCKLFSAFGFIQDSGDPGSLVLRAKPGNPDNDEDQYLFDVEQSTETEKTEIDKKLSPKTNEVINNDFGGGVTVPNQTDAIVFYKHGLPYPVTHTISIGPGNLVMTYNRTSLFHDIPVTAFGRVVHKDSEGNVYPGHDIDLYRVTQTVRPQNPYHFPSNIYAIPTESIFEQWVFLNGDTLSLEMGVSLEMKKASIIDLTIATGDVSGGVFEKGGFSFSFEDEAPPDSVGYGFDSLDLLKYGFDYLVGKNKLSIDPALSDPLKKGDIDSLFGHKTVQGSGLRGFDQRENPLSFNILELYQTLSRQFELALTYTGGSFTLKREVDIWGKTNVNLGEVSGLEECVMNVPGVLKTGDQQTPDLDDYYLQSGGHNPTTYNYPTKRGVSEDDLQSPYSSGAQEIEYLRRYNTPEVASLSLKSDDKNFSLKCYGNDGLITEKQERFEIVEAPRGFGDANICLLPSWVIYRNRHTISMPLYRNPGLVYFGSSKYRVAIQTMHSSGLTFGEQSSIPPTLFERRRQPRIFEFEKPMTPEILEQIQNNPNARINFSHDGESYAGFLYADTEQGVYIRSGKWTIQSET